MAVNTVIATSLDRGSPEAENSDVPCCLDVFIVILLRSFLSRRTRPHLFMAMAVPSLVELSITDA